MDLLNDSKKDKLSKPTLDQVQKQKQEFKLIDSILRTAGLNLYAYSYIKDKIYEVKIEHTPDCYTTIFEEKLVVDNNKNYSKTMIDPRNEHFEALNMRNAIKRVNRYKQGLIKELCNLKHKGKITFLFKI